MCGIAGFAGQKLDRHEATAILASMVESIRHRGPDEQCVLTGDGFGLGHARLSIIDLSTGQQPMSACEGTLHITFNGEIFNYVELREKLISRGHQFRTKSDTETILHAYAECG